MCVFGVFSFGKKFMKFGPVVPELLKFKCQFFEKTQKCCSLFAHPQIKYFIDSSVHFTNYGEFNYEHLKKKLSKIGSVLHFL